MPADVVPPPPARRPRSPGTNALLFIVLPLIALVFLGGVAALALSIRVGQRVEINHDLEAGRSVSVDVPGAAFSFRPSDDGQVHVYAVGSSLGEKPSVTASTSGGVTRISGDGCSHRWFSFCSLEVTVALPASLELTAVGENGRIEASGLTGPLTLVTTNGGIETRGAEGPQALRSTNGGIEVTDAASSQVLAQTTNGAVELDFVDAPIRVEARSTNGAITVRVPVEGASYFVDARTTNGAIDADEVPSDRRSERTITAETTNGSVRVADAAGDSDDNSGDNG